MYRSLYIKTTVQDVFILYAPNIITKNLVRYQLLKWLRIASRFCVRVSPSMSFYILLFKTCSHHCHKIMPSQVFYCSSINFFLQIYRGDIFNHSNVEFGQPKKKKVEFGQLLVEIIKILTISRRNYLKFSNFRVSAINNGLKIPTF